MTLTLNETIILYNIICYVRTDRGTANRKGSK